MLLTRQKKQEIIKRLEEKFGKAALVAFLNFHGLKVKDSSELRSKLKKHGFEYKVAKKTFGRIALKNLGLDAEKINLEGEVAFGLSYEDPVGLPKIVFDFAKIHPEIKVLGGIFEKQYIDASALNIMAKLPVREVLLGQAVSAISLPLQGLIGTLNSPLINFVYLLQNLSKSKK